MVIFSGAAIIGGGGGVTFGFNSKVNSREEGGWMIKITFQGVNFEHSMKIIATYWSGRTFLKTKSVMYASPKELDPC